MKYYHIIYNSSEKPMEGGVGFGIRTATDGTPESLLKIIRDSNIFSDDWETYEKKPTPAQMKENPAAIESVPKNYAVTTIADSLGNQFTIIARRAYVGFDYGFYKNGQPTRPGNYVIDYYAFDQTPDSEAYEILYETALDGSNHFIPKSVQPVESNEEMREISLGAQPPLPISDKPFKASTTDELDPDTVKLFFHYFKAKNEGKKLVVRSSPEKALKLTADLYRMLTPDAAQKARTYINLRSQGINDNFDIFFIHDDYPYQVYEGLYNYVEIDSASFPAIDEAKTFGQDLTNYVTSSFSANKSDIDDTLRWILLPEYQTVKLLSKLTIDSFFIYCIQPGNFFYDNLMDASGNALNDEFLKVLCAYTKKAPQNAARFDLIVAETMNEVTPENVISRIAEYNHLQSIGFDLNKVTDEVKDHVCSVLLSDIDLLKRALETIGYDGLQKFFVKSIFEAHNSYVDSNALDPYMPKLYKWFLTDEELQKKVNTLYHRFFKREMDGKIFVAIMDDVYKTDTEGKTKFFRQVLAKDLKPFKTVWPFLKYYLDKAPSTPDFLVEFESKINQPELAPMFYYSIVKNKPLFANIDGIKRLTKALEQNSQLKQQIATNYSTDKLYDGFFSQLKKSGKNSPKESLDLINKCVLKFLPGIADPKMQTLADYLTLIAANNVSSAADFSGPRLDLLLQEIIDQRDSKLFHAILPQLLKAAKKGDIKATKIAKQYSKFNPDAKPIEVVNALVDPTDPVEMLAAICVDTFKLQFKEAQLLCQEINLDNKATDLFLSICYPKQFKAWIFRQKIKRAFETITKALTPKKKSQPQPKGEAKPSKKNSEADKKPSPKTPKK